MRADDMLIFVQRINMKRIILLLAIVIFFTNCSYSAVRLNIANQKPVPLYPGLGKSRLPSRENIGLTVGLKAGAAAGLSGAVGDLMYSLSHLLPGASIRGGVGYLTGSNSKENDNVKIATVNLDGVLGLNFLKNNDVPFDVYVGGGLIYPWKVNKDQGSGGWGAHAYMGGKYLLEKNSSIYGELAYSGIKYSQKQNAIRGIEAMLGFGYSF